MRELIRSRNFILAQPTSKTNLSSSPFCSSCAPAERTATSLCQRRFVLETCQNLRQLFQIQAHLTTSGLFHNPFWAGRVLLYSSDFGDIDYTVLIFRYIDWPDTLCINTVIKAYSNSRVSFQAVVFYFEWLRNGFLPNSYTFVPLVGSCAKMGCVKSGQKCHGQAVKNGADCVLPVQNSLIHMYGCCGDVDLASKVFFEMSKRDLVSWNSIIDGYARLGHLGLARKSFDVMPERNVVSWNIMINGYLKGGNPGCGLKLFREMVKLGLRGTDTTVVSMLTACGRSARLKEGRSVHGSLFRMFLRSNIVIDTALIDMYGRCKRVDIARRVFERMSKRNLVCWNAMILGHCLHGNPKDGLTLFGEMLGRKKSKHGETNLVKSLRPDEGQEGIIPDEITFVGVLCACARSGFLTEGRNYFTQMINVFCIKPNFAHYWCMANLYASVGLIQQAEEILRNMAEDDYDDKTSESLFWANLLGSCRFLGDVSLGEQIARSLIDMEPQKPSYYQLLLNVYAVGGRWEDVARVKEMMKDRKVGRMPGCNLIDLKEIVHKLKVGDNLREGMEVSMMMGEIAQKLSFSSKQPSLNNPETGI
jgi:pentatricopeptide repeat protein